MAQRSPNKVGGFPLGAVNPAARQTLYGSFGLPGCGLVCTAQTGPMASVYLPSPCYLDRPSPSLLENKKNWRENMTPGSCALCPGGYKSQLYGGLCRGLRDLCAPSFPFSHPDHRTIFRHGDRRGVGGERGGRRGEQVFPLSQTVMKAGGNGEDTASGWCRWT